MSFTRGTLQRGADYSEPLNVKDIKQEDCDVNLYRLIHNCIKAEGLLNNVHHKVI